MAENNWYVITGAPCSGKTTLINELEKRKYKTIREAARVFIDKELARGLTLEEIRNDEASFQQKVLQMKIETERILNPDDIIFFDRGIPDTRAYNDLYEVPTNAILENALKTCSYRKIFILDQLPFKSDYSRTETEEQQSKLQKLLRNAYAKLGFETVNVPVLEVNERVNYILNFL